MNQGRFSQSIVENVLCLFLQDFPSLKAMDLIIGQTIWFASCEVIVNDIGADER